MTGDEHTKNLFNFLSYLNKSHDELHLVAGSDRAGEYRSHLERYNGKPDKNGKMLFNFKKWKVHEVEGKREDSGKDPRKMSRKELVRSASASKLEKLAKEGNYEHFKAYHPDMPESHVKKVYGQIRKGLSLNEEVTRKELAPMLDSFVSFASDKLGLKSMPNLRYKTDKDGYNSFAAYNPSSNELSVSTMNRHPMDIFRSVAHELVHHKQNEDGKLGKDIAKEGSTGSDIENEANSEAGKIMRWFAKSNPDMFKQGYVVEETIVEGINDPGKLKAIFLAGGPGSGKDFVMNSVLRGEGLREVNSDVAFEYLMQKNGLDLEMPDEERVERDIVRGRAKNITKEQERLALAGRLGLIINGTADDLEKIKTIKRNLEADGYETMMVFVNTSNDVSRERNVERGKLGKRKVPDGTNKQGVPDGTENIRQEKWDLAQKNIGELQKIFGNKNFAVVDNTADVRKVSPEEKEKIQTNFNRVRRMAQQFVRADNQNPAAKVWIEKEAQKRGITYQQPRATKTLTQVRQSVPNVIHKPDNELMAQARKLGLSYYGFGRFGRKVGNENKVLYHSKGGKLVRVQPMNEEKIKGKDGKACWKGYRYAGTKNNKDKCVPVEEGRENIDQEKEYKKHNRIEKKVKRKLAETIDTSFEKYMIDPANREVGTNSVVQIYKSMTPGQDCVSENKKVKIVRKKLTREDNNIPRGGLPIGNGLGQELNVSKAPGFYMGFSNVGNSVYEATQSIQEWAMSPKTQQKFAEKYGNLAEQKLIDAALRLEAAGCGCDHKMKKSVKMIKEGLGLGYGDQSSIGVQRKQEIEEDQLNERGADSKGYYRSTESGAGLTPAGAKKFGVKTAVTKDPSELDPDSKSAKRRKSFCARMGGMPGAMEDEKGRPTRKKLALDKWNC